MSSELTGPQVKQILSVLNSAISADRDAVNGLMRHRVVCNSVLAGHPSVQVGIVNKESGVFMSEKSDENDFRVGFLGVLNGITRSMGWTIIATTNDEGVFIRFGAMRNIDKDGKP